MQRVCTGTVAAPHWAPGAGESFFKWEAACNGEGCLGWEELLGVGDCLE